MHIPFPKQCEHAFHTPPQWSLYAHLEPGMTRIQNKTLKDKKNVRGRWAVLVNITHSEILSYWLHLFTCVQVILIGLPMSFNCNKGLSQHLKHNRRFITNLQINCLIYQIHTTFWVQHTNNTASNADHTTTTIKQISKDKQLWETLTETGLTVAGSGAQVRRR